MTTLADMPDSSLSHARKHNRFIRNNGLSLVILTMFLLSWIGQILTGWHVYNAEQSDHHLPTVSLHGYLLTGDFFEATAENWESEFLQMAVFIWFTSFLFQKGSPESNDPDEPADNDGPVTAESPWPVRRGGWVLKVYENSLAICFFTLFFVCVLLHAAGGAAKYSAEQASHGQAGVNMIQYLGSAQFWFESFQNWQSEFLSIAAMVILSIFLRQKNSPESKPVAMAHWEQE